MMKIKLYGFWRSLATYRVRVALKLKDLDYEEVSINLMTGQQNEEAYRAINPQGVVPALVVKENQPPIFQSMAILDYLDQVFPGTSLFPIDPLDRARAIGLAHICTSDAHPLVVPRVRTYLEKNLALSEVQRQEWLAHWTLQALQSYEKTLASNPKSILYSVGNSISVADICLASQVVAAGFFGVKLDTVPKVKNIFDELIKLKAFQDSAPLKQSDAPH